MPRAFIIATPDATASDFSALIASTFLPSHSNAAMLFIVYLFLLFVLTSSSAADESGGAFAVFCKRRDTFGSLLDEFVRFHLLL